MTTEQLQGIVWLIIGVLFGAAMVYVWRGKRKFPAYRGWFLLLLFFGLAVNSFEVGSLQPMFVWLSSIIGLFIALDILTFWGKELNEKLVTGSMLIVIIVGGILANAYVFSVPSSVGARIFSLVVFILMIMPILFALIAYLKGKKGLSKKLVSIGFYWKTLPPSVS